MYLNAGKLISDIRRIAAENYGFIYNYVRDDDDNPDLEFSGSCVYFAPNGAPSCLPDWTGLGKARFYL